MNNYCLMIDMHLRSDLERYDKENVELARHNSYFLQVPSSRTFADLN